MNNKVILEVVVDKNNERGVFVAEQVLNILHNTIEEIKKLFIFKFYKSPSFSFEIANIDGQIRFFFICGENYKDFLVNQIYAQFNNIEIIEVKEYIGDGKKYIGEIALTKQYCYPLKIYSDFKEKTEKDTIDPFSSLTSALCKGSKSTTRLIQINFSPIIDKKWKSDKIIGIFSSKYPVFIKKILLSKFYKYFSLVFLPFTLIIKLFHLLVNNHDKGHGKEHDEHKDKSGVFETKFKGFGFKTSINIGFIGDSFIEAKTTIREISSSLSIFNDAGGNSFKLKKIYEDEKGILIERKNKGKIILNSLELAGLVHIPTFYVKTPGINWIVTKSFEPPRDLPPLLEDNQTTPIGVTNFRSIRNEFGLYPQDRRRHVYIIGKTGMGKSTLLENMVYDDICKGRGVAVIDPHGDLADTIVSNIPKSRTNDVILFDPSDYENPIAFNMLETVSKELRPIVASGVIGIFKKMFDSWGPRLEYILRNTVLTLLETPGSTLVNIPLLLTQKHYRKKVVSKLTDHNLIRFWEAEFETMDPRQLNEAVSPILNKVGQFLSSSIVRNIVGQPKNPFSIRWAMDKGKIVIINLSKGKIGEDSSSLLGSMMITKFQIDAMSRADIAESERRDFYLYVDEFQNFATDSFATILSEARKYKLNLVMANQYIDQMSEVVRGAVFGNVGTTITFQVGHADSKILSEAMGGEDIISQTDLTNLSKYHIYTRLLINGMPSPVFSAITFPPIKFNDEDQMTRREKILKVSREKYSKSRDFVEQKTEELSKGILEQEKSLMEKEREYKEKMKEEKMKKSREARQA